MRGSDVQGPCWLHFTYMMSFQPYSTPAWWEVINSALRKIDKEMEAQALRNLPTSLKHKR